VNVQVVTGVNNLSKDIFIPEVRNMKFVDSLTKGITLFKAFQFLGKDIPKYYKRFPKNDFDAWGNRKYQFRKAIKIAKEILNIPQP
jgi:hypothetical protein